MNVLVCYGSKRGGTRDLAEWIGSALREQGMPAEVRPAGGVEDVAGYDAVVIGGAVYVFRWHRDARGFVRRQSRALSSMPVWLFSSGPLDDSASQGPIPPVRFVRRAFERLNARGHETFGGRLEPGYSSRLPVGDWRDRDQVEQWAGAIAADLRQLVATGVT